MYDVRYMPSGRETCRGPGDRTGVFPGAAVPGANVLQAASVAEHHRDRDGGEHEYTRRDVHRALARAVLDEAEVDVGGEAGDEHDPEQGCHGIPPRVGELSGT